MPVRKLRIVSVKEIWKKLFEVAKKLNSSEFFLRLNNTSNAEDATANDTRSEMFGYDTT